MKKLILMKVCLHFIVICLHFSQLFVYIFLDEHSETFQRDVLLNFVLGLENSLQEQILASDAFDLGM